jgi:hypothetical protein
MPNLSSLQAIDATAMLLLNEIAVRNLEGKTITVTEVMTISTIASPATIHRKLDELREAGLIEQIFEGNNRRTKYLVPTKTANTYFDKMASAITTAVNS